MSSREEEFALFPLCFHPVFGVNGRPKQIRQSGTVSCLCDSFSSSHSIYLDLFWYCTSLITGGNGDLMLCLKLFHFFFNPVSGNSRPTTLCGPGWFWQQLGGGAGGAVPADTHRPDIRERLPTLLCQKEG